MFVVEDLFLCQSVLPNWTRANPQAHAQNRKKWFVRCAVKEALPSETYVQAITRNFFSDNLLASVIPATAMANRFVILGS